MLTKIVSFGYKHGTPVDGSNTVIIDIRGMFNNPYHDKSLRGLTGKNSEVQYAVMKTPNFDALYQYLMHKISVPGVAVAYVGCTGGKHRSVFLAESLGSTLSVPVEHRDLGNH